MKHKTDQKINTSGFLESIKVVNRKLCHLHYHNLRMNNTRKDLLGMHSMLDLAEIICIPEPVDQRMHKCRIVYSKEIIHIEFVLYRPRTIQTVRLMEDNTLQYNYKFADRSGIERLFERRGTCDEILIVKNGLLTDTSYGNIALGSNNTWYTPKFPLLPGTARARLLEEQVLIEREIKVEDLFKFDQLRIFNAMMDVVLPIDHRTMFT